MRHRNDASLSHTVCIRSSLRILPLHCYISASLHCYIATLLHFYLTLMHHCRTLFASTPRTSWRYIANLFILHHSRLQHFSLCILPLQCYISALVLQIYFASVRCSYLPFCYMTDAHGFPCSFSILALHYNIALKVKGFNRILNVQKVTKSKQLFLTALRKLLKLTILHFL